MKFKQELIGPEVSIHAPRVRGDPSASEGQAPAEFQSTPPV
jgi:hypothetical protein